MHASTFEICVALGVGVGDGVAEAFEEELDDPQALITRPHVATTAIKPLAEMLLATAEQLTLRPAVSQGDGGLSSG
jgi:hypothetical protein